jgi:hypothetical protein
MRDRLQLPGIKMSDEFYDSDLLLEDQIGVVYESSSDEESEFETWVGEEFENARKSTDALDAAGDVTGGEDDEEDAVQADQVNAV